MKFAFATFLIALLWQSALASNSGEDESASDESINRHIVKGQRENIDRVPFTCLIKYQTHICGCVIISPYWVLTVASCIVRGQTATVVAGITDLADIGNPAVGITRQVPPGRIFVHTGFHEGNIFSDNIALVHTVPPIPTNQTNVQQIRLMSDTFVPHRLDWRIVYTSGWGVTEFSGGEMSEHLMGGRMIVLPAFMCPPVNQTSKHICTVANPSTVCGGDNGGPVFMIEADGNPTLVGIVSLVNTHCSVLHPAAHTYVGAYRAWIKNISGV